MNNIKIFLNGKMIDLSDRVERTSLIEVDDRSDEIFATGTFKVWNDLKYNVPPYTPCILSTISKDGVVELEEDFLCVSSNSKYLTYENLYVHDFQLIEATAILSCYVLGSKSFSITGTNKLDSEKMEIICELMAQKYNVKFTYDFSEFNQQQEFQFGSGMKMYDALLEISKTYNCVPKIYTFQIDENTGTIIYNITFKKLDETTPYVIKENKILRKEYRQNLDNYCKTLESETMNVVDRNNPMWVRNLTCRSNEVKLSFDTAKLILPTRIERVNKFLLQVRTRTIQFDNLIGQVFFKKYGIENDPYFGYAYPKAPVGKTQTLTDWCLELKAIDQTIMDTPLYRIGEDICQKYNLKKTIVFDQFQWTLREQGKTPDGKDTRFQLIFDDSKNLYAGAAVDITDRLLEKSQYDLLENRLKPGYCYYTSGEKEIDGMNITYRDDFWNLLLGNKVDSFFEQISNNEDSGALILENIYDDETGAIITYSSGIKKNPLENVFDIQYLPLIDPFLSSNKAHKPLNETDFISSSRSFDLSSKTIDFDRAIFSLEKNNEMLGYPELILEYQFDNDMPPYSCQKIVFDDKDWYVSCVQKYYDLGRNYCVLNLVEASSKVAEVIGTPTQMNVLKNPIDSIVDRYIFVEKDGNGITIPNENIYIKFVFTSETSHLVLYKRATLMAYKDQVYVYAETIDQYCFDLKGKKLDQLYEDNKIYEQIQVGYVDRYNEVKRFEAVLVSLDLAQESPSFESVLKASYDLPEYSGTSETILLLTDHFDDEDGNGMRIYKDARERLLFTFKLKNATLE